MADPPQKKIKSEQINGSVVADPPSAPKPEDMADVLRQIWDYEHPYEHQQPYSPTVLLIKDDEDGNLVYVNTEHTERGMEVFLQGLFKNVPGALEYARANPARHPWADRHIRDITHIKEYARKCDQVGYDRDGRVEMEWSDAVNEMTELLETCDDETYRVECAKLEVEANDNGDNPKDYVHRG
jgi:hypothetical protein